MRRREFIGLAGAATILAGHSELRAELHTRKHRIGFLGPTTLVERIGLKRCAKVSDVSATLRGKTSLLVRGGPRENMNASLILLPS